MRYVIGIGLHPAGWTVEQGKPRIYKVREDYEKARGGEYGLQKFHDDFVRRGGLPSRLIRRVRLPGDTGPSL